MDTQNNSEQNLLKKLGIKNFKLTGEYGENVLDLLVAYTHQSSTQSTGVDKVKTDLEKQGFNIKAVKKLLELPPEELEKIMAGSSKMADTISEDDLPENYKLAKANVEKMKELLINNQTLPADKRLSVENDIKTAEQDLAELKTKLLQEQLEKNPQLLAQNPETLKVLFELIDSETPEYKTDQKTINLRKIRKEIEENFLIMKGFDMEVISKITNGTHEEMSLTKKEFGDLLKAIWENDELLNQQSSPFTNTQS